MTFDPRKITARQIMDQDVLAFNQDTSVKEAIATLSEHSITEAPVVNASRECVGEFSRLEAVKRIEAVESAEVPWGIGGASCALANLDDQEVSVSRPRSPDLIMVELVDEAVQNWMSTEPRWVSTETTIEEVCRRMAHDGVQQILVLEGKRLRGVISTLDVVRLVAGLKPDGAGRNGN